MLNNNIPWTLLLKSLFSSCNVDLNQYNGLCYTLTYFWAWTVRIQALLLSFHHEVKQIPLRCLLLVIWFTSVQWAQSLSFLNEVKTNRNWQLLCSQFLGWTFWHGQDSSLRNTLCAAFHMYFCFSHRPIQSVPASMNLQGKLLVCQAFLCIGSCSHCSNYIAPKRNVSTAWI